MIPGFQQYLVDKGFKRTKGITKEEDYDSTFVSSYGPLNYSFKKDGHYCYWGLSEREKPPVMCLGADKISIIQNRDIREDGKRSLRTYEDGYRILFTKWGTDKFDVIYDVFISEDKYFEIDCRDEKDIKIEILTQNASPYEK